jgi:spore coat protein U-like protein
VQRRLRYLLDQQTCNQRTDRAQAKTAIATRTNAARTIVWGSRYWGLPGTPPTIDLPLGLNGSGGTSRTIYARIFGAQPTAPAGAYSSNFTAADDVFDYDYFLLLGCDGLISKVGNPTFTASASIPDNCHVSAEDINFGAQGVLTANIDAAGQVSVTCTSGTPYTVALDGGTMGGAPTARKMSKGAETIRYGIYQDAARTQPWGDTVGTTVAGTGSGLAQVLVTYDQVPPQMTPSPGNYADTVVVTLTY